jgi:outer membrane protein TolC
MLLRRPDVWAAEERLKSAEADLSAARKALLPTITLTGQSGFQSGALSRLLRPESAIYSLAAGLVQPIFDGGRLRAEVSLSDAARLEMLESYRKAIVTALSDVETALIAVRESAAAEAAQARAVAASRRAFDLSEQRLRAGTIDLATLLAAQQSLFQAQEGVVQARLARLQAATSLFQALGGDWSAATARSEAKALAASATAIPPSPLPLELVKTE